MTELHGLKVVIMLGCLEVGGAEQQAFMLALWLRGHCGVNVEIWGVAHGGKLEERCDENNIPWAITGNPFSGSLISSVSNLLRIAWQIRRAGVDILLPYTLVPNAICGLIWRLAGIRNCIWNQRDEGIEGHLAPYERWAVRFTPQFVANSEAGASYLKQNLHADPARVVVIPNGVELSDPYETCDHWRKQLGLAEKSVCVCMIANLSPKKDHVTLLRAWKLVIDSLNPEPSSLKLVLVGGYVGTERELTELSYSLGINDYVAFPGFITDIAGILQAVDIGVFSSRSEGLPNGVLECMAAGKPIVATDIAGLRAALGDNYPLLVPPEDCRKMAEKLTMLITDLSLREQIGNQNLERAVTCFGVEQFCRTMACLIGRPC